MLEKARILDGQDRVGKNLGDILDRGEIAALLAEFAYQFAFC